MVVFLTNNKFSNGFNVDFATSVFTSLTSPPDLAKLIGLFGILTVLKAILITNVGRFFVIHFDCKSLILREIVFACKIVLEKQIKTRISKLFLYSKTSMFTFLSYYNFAICFHNYFAAFFTPDTSPPIFATTICTFGISIVLEAKFIKNVQRVSIVGCKCKFGIRRDKWKRITKKA